MLDLATTSRAVDRRIVRPSVLVSRIDAYTDDEDAYDLADEVSRLVADDPEFLGREPWRQVYAERVSALGGQILPLSRWPIEDNPPVVTVIDNGVVDADTYSVTGRHRHSLYRLNGWATASNGPVSLTGAPTLPTSRLYYSVPYTAGYLMPGQISTWAAGLAVGGGSNSYGTKPGWVRPTDRSLTLVFQKDTASGVTGGTEPTWPTTVGDTVSDNGNIWTARAAAVWPAWAEMLAAEMAEALYDPFARGQRQGVDVRSVRVSGSHSISFGGAKSADLAAQYGPRWRGLR